MVLEWAEDEVDEGQHHAVKPKSKRGSKRTAAEVLDIPAASPTNALASHAAAPALDAAAVKRMKVTELREALKVRGLDTKGLKAALVTRLMGACV